jgi:hypothetical protein
VAAAACGRAEDSAPQGAALGGDDSSDGYAGAAGHDESGAQAGASGGDAVGELRFGVSMIAPECYSREVELEVWNVKDAAGNDVMAHACEWQFDDGGSMSGCNGRYEYTQSGHRRGTVTVWDLNTGATGSLTPGTNVEEPHEVTVTASAPECGLSFTWESTVSTPGERGTQIEPADKVLTPASEYRQAGSGVVTVSEPGVYTVTVSAEDERAIPICETQATSTVTVKACDNPAENAANIGGIDVWYGSCGRTAEFEPSNITNGAGQPIASPQCSWTFTDGGTASGCAVKHQFASGRMHSGTLTVLDPATGAVATKTSRTVEVYNDPMSLEILTNVPECGLTFSYNAVQTGGRGYGWFFIGVDGEGHDYWTNPETRYDRAGQISVSKPGTYVLSAEIEEENSTRYCSANTKKVVTLKECPGPAPEPPPSPECPPELLPYNQHSR